MKKSSKKIESELVCKSVASLNSQIAQDMDKKDKSLQELLDEKEEGGIHAKHSGESR